MSKTQLHKEAQSKAAGKEGRTEIRMKNRKILDAISKSGHKATEVEKSGTMSGLSKAARRLRSRRSKQKVLQVPSKDMDKASQAMRDVGVSGTVKNMSGTKRRSVR